MKVVAVPCLENIYAHLVIDEETGYAAAIYPVWPDAVLDAARSIVLEAAPKLKWFFEGSRDQMYNSLCKTLASLPPETEVYCSHEYIQKNLEFAFTLEPENEALLKKMEWAVQQRKQNLPTVPSTIGDELEYIPFMRVEKKSLRQATGRESPIEFMAEVRRLKDNYKLHIGAHVF